MQSLHLYGRDGQEWVVNPLAISHAMPMPNQDPKMIAVFLLPSGGSDRLVAVMSIAAFEKEWNMALAKTALAAQQPLPRSLDC